MHVVGPLQRHDGPFDGAQEGKGHCNGDGYPNGHMDPESGPVCHLCPNYQRDDDVTNYENGEVGRCVIGAMMGEILAALLALISGL